MTDQTVLNTEWRIAESTDENDLHRIVWEDDEGDVFEVCDKLFTEEAEHIVALHNRSLKQ